MSTPAEIAAGTAVELFLAAMAIGLLYRVWGRLLPMPKRQVVLPFQRGIILRDERIEKVLSPGSHWVGHRSTMLLCDTRPKPFQIVAQDQVSADGLMFRISLAGEYRIVDPAAFVKESSDAFGTYFLAVRQALHNSVGEIDSNAILNGHALLTARMKELLVPQASQLGIELTKLDVWESVPVGWQRQP